MRVESDFEDPERGLEGKGKLSEALQVAAKKIERSPFESQGKTIHSMDSLEGINLRTLRRSY